MKLCQFNNARSQYIVASSSKLEKTIWVCGKCKNDNMEFILLGKWKLIGRSTDDGLCDLCELGDGDDEKGCGEEVEGVLPNKWRGCYHRICPAGEII